MLLRGNILKALIHWGNEAKHNFSEMLLLRLCATAVVNSSSAPTRDNNDDQMAVYSYSFL